MHSIYGLFTQQSRIVQGHIVYMIASKENICYQRKVKRLTPTIPKKESVDEHQRSTQKNFH